MRARIYNPALMTKPKKQPFGQTIGGVLFGFEQQVLRTTPPPQELVHHARPDAPVPAGDGGVIRIEMPIESRLSPPDAEPAPVVVDDEPAAGPGARGNR